MAIYGSLGDIDVGAISKSISDTAVDIFVYDTRKDSDGGAWRKRTQHTSWYNETLNTATRGSRRDFPAVAVIVSTATSVTIYDGDDPDMPMWMVFNRGTDTNTTMWWDGNNTNTATSVVAINGLLFLTTSNAGSYGADFIGERWIYFYNSQVNAGYRYNGGGIVNRNSAVSSRVVSQQFNGYPPSGLHNDVAMTVLPNAPIDPSTGLPVPTIAVATAGGVSVIKDDGTVISQAHSYGTSMRIDVNNSLLLATHNGRTGGQNAEVIDLVTLTQIGDKNPSPVHADNDVGTNENDYGYGVNSGANYMPFQLPDFGSTVNPLIKGLDLYFGRNFLIHLCEERNAPANTMSNFITTTYNTGWMHGNCKGAWLSDTSTASVTGTELVTNGDFATSTLTSYGQLYNCSLSVVSNQLRVTSTAASGYCEFYIGISDTTKYHYFSFQFVGASGITQFGIYAGSTGYITDTNAGWTNSSYTASRSAGTYTILIPPGNSIVGFVFNIASLGQTWTFDNISLKPVQELDRSVNNRGLAVYGTITKSAVATGSNLVAYGGFSISNYLYQPNVNINFANPWYLMGWFPTGVGTISLEKLSTSGYNNTVAAIFATAGAQSSRSKFSDFSDSSTGERFFALVYSNGFLRHYAGSTLIRTITGTYTTETADLLIGIRSYQSVYDSISNGQQISLLRLGQSAPSPEQILKIYNDEKALFQPNSQCTLYGSSDAVTALAYDETAKLLSVGTSSGRSDFQGLERINNTTTAVTTAISASNGLIAEQ